MRRNPVISLTPLEEPSKQGEKYHSSFIKTHTILFLFSTYPYQPNPIFLGKHEISEFNFSNLDNEIFEIILQKIVRSFKFSKMQVWHCKKFLKLCYIFFNVW